MRTNPALRASDRSYDELVCGQTALWFYRYLVTYGEKIGLVGVFIAKINS